MNEVLGKMIVEKPSCFRRILVPMTLGSNSHATLQLAANLAQEYAEELVLLHVVILDVPGEESDIPRERLRHLLIKEAEKELKDLLQQVEVTVPVSAIVRAGTPAEVILRIAKELKMEVILMCWDSAHQICDALPAPYHHEDHHTISKAI